MSRGRPLSSCGVPASYLSGVAHTGPTIAWQQHSTRVRRRPHLPTRAYSAYVAGLHLPRVVLASTHPPNGVAATPYLDPRIVVLFRSPAPAPALSFLPVDALAPLCWRPPYAFRRTTTLHAGRHHHRPGRYTSRPRLRCCVSASLAFSRARHFGGWLALPARGDSPHVKVP